MTTAITVTTQHVNAGDYALCHATTNDERLVMMWLQSGKRANSPLTQASYLRTWRSFSACVGKPLQAITLEDLQVWRSQLTGKDTTQKTAIAIVRSLFSFAVKVGFLRMSPAVMIETPPAPTKAHTRRVLTQGNIERMVDACETDRESALIRCLYSSGAYQRSPCAALAGRYASRQWRRSPLYRRRQRTQRQRGRRKRSHLRSFAAPA